MRAVAILLMAVGVANPQSAIRNPQSNDSSGRLVQMDVSAMNARGQTVLDLEPADFELREDGTAQAVERVRLVRDEPRLVAVFLDEYHVGAGSTERVRDAMARFVDQQLSRRDLVVVMKPLDSVLTIRLTLDRAEARRAIATFEGRKGEYEPRNAYERDYIAGTPARIEASRAQVALSAINALAVQLGGMADHRKTLIVVTEELVRTERRRGQEYLPTLDTIGRSANRSNVAVYPLDPTDALHDAATADPRVDALRVLAAETDGRTTAVDLSSGLKRAVADSTDYYLLTYRSSRPDDGRFRSVDVRVTRPGVTLRARKGYFGPSPDEATRVALLARMNEPKVPPPVEPAPHASPLIRPWFGMSRGNGGKTRVTFVWEPASHVPGERVRHTASRLVLTALAGDGTVLFEGPVAPTGPAAMNEPGTTSARAVFDTAPGRLRLRMAIQDGAAQVIDRDVREISIRDLRGTAVGTPEILRARNAREFRSLDGAAAVPVAAREFSRTERLLIRFPAYGPAGVPLAVSARLLGRMGQVVRDLSIAPAATPDGDNAIDLPLAGFAVGDYTIEVTASSTAGNVKDRVGFRVTS